MDDELTWTFEESNAGVTVVVRGALTRRSGNALHAVLRKVLLDRARLMVDVSAMRVLWRPAIAVFTAALAAAGGWPLARLVIVDTGGAIARELRARRGADQLLIAADRAAGWRAMESRPARVHRTIDLPGDATAPAYARALVRSACTEWVIDVDLDRSVAVANELVTNAVEHAGCQLVLHLSHDVRGLTIGVRDGSLWAPAHQQGKPDLASPQLGLRLVQEFSDSWGVLHHSDGKTVWALLGPGASGRSTR